MEEKYTKKKLRYLFLSWGSLLGSGAIVGAMYLLGVKESITYAVIFTLLITEMLLLLNFKSKISFFDLRHRYSLLLNSRVGLEQTSCQFDNKWMDSLKSDGFSNYVNNADFAIYYRIGKSLTSRYFVKRGLLEIITVFRNPELDFYGETIEKEYKNLWMKYEKEHKINKQVIIQFKKYESFNENIKEELNKIICYRLGDNHLVHINCGFIPNSKSIYYLHSDKYYPSAYYKKAVETIKSIVK